jgi:hypothetical protein
LTAAAGSENAATELLLDILSSFLRLVGKTRLVPKRWRTPGRFAIARGLANAPASWTAAALRRFLIRATHLFLCGHRDLPNQSPGKKTKKRAGGTEGAAKQWWSFLKPATNEVGRIYPPLTI